MARCNFLNAACYMRLAECFAWLKLNKAGNNSIADCDIWQPLLPQ